MLIPTLYNTIRSSVIDPLHYHYWKAGQTLAQRLAAQLSIDGGPYSPIMLSVDGGPYQHVIVEDE